MPTECTSETPRTKNSIRTKFDPEADDAHSPEKLFDIDYRPIGGDGAFDHTPGLTSPGIVPANGLHNQRGSPLVPLTINWAEEREAL